MCVTFSKHGSGEESSVGVRKGDGPLFPASRLDVLLSALDVELAIVACNTASTLIMPALRVAGEGRRVLAGPGAAPVWGEIYGRQFIW